MKLTGRVWRFGDDVDTDLIIPARYLNTSDPKELAAHCMEDADPSFAGKVQPGDIIVAGKNFGCGSSREHAPIAIKAAGVACVIGATFARIFYRNAINIGLPILESPEASSGIEEGHQVEVDLETGTIKNLTTGESYSAKPFPPFMQELIAAGGLIPYVSRTVGRE
ncbi:MAG TPA: 3-isopropylmalate dehydratase small subunit [Firmicutes bacterium]|jgi:3-isopropylmalate/(R)-2-methylmalate dehydratase small subunit|nr:3-isopropylmalate dehydratase small subunit [Bacillota bacterium]HOQ23449.1 3-isopropylmalate dehydratase small subunit [Bacillota bacterium]HPT67857.1 3-isopropylmalate dehydratase small subunit [Bacillota bacterium]